MSRAEMNERQVFQFCELRQKYCYPKGAVMKGKTIRCAKSNCYRGRNGQNHEPEDTERSAWEDEAAIWNRWNGA